MIHPTSATRDRLIPKQFSDVYDHTINDVTLLILSLCFMKYAKLIINTKSITIVSTSSVNRGMYAISIQYNN